MADTIKVTPTDEYIEVMLPLPLQALFTYRVPDSLRGKISVGCRVVVPFGLKKFYTAIVVSAMALPPEGYKVKDVADLLDSTPVVRNHQLKLWNWIADYYLCAVGDVYKAAMPAGMKLESETFIEVNPDFPIEEFGDNALETGIFQLVEHEKRLTLSGIRSKLNIKGVSAAVNRMIDEGKLIVSEKLVERYRPQRIAMVRPLFDPAAPQSAFEAVHGAKKQETLLLAYLALRNSGACQSDGSIARDALLERGNVTPAVLKATEQKGVFESFRKEINRFKLSETTSATLPALTPVQAKALDEIHQSWKSKEVTLLHGVTSSGKTEIYIHLIDYVLRQGGQTLYLVPEIALTTQLTRRLQAVFGNKVLIYHSKFTDNERVDIWKKMLTTREPYVVIGARSAVFLPFSSLRMIIVDEEHESSFKQFDPAPRYNARDVAIVLAHMHGAKTLLGSATPSIETYYKALNGKFGHVALTQRYGDVELPHISVIDMKAAHKAKQACGTFANQTIRYAREALGQGNQVIFFQNRRGYAPLARCKQCAWSPRCEQCDVALTYHSHLHQLQCHYCGAVYPLPKVCPQCHEPAIEILGYGTERIEEVAESVFKDVPLLRMDLDSTRAKDSYIKIIDDFSEGKAKILIGTQMVTKGLDFGGVSLVGVLNADSVINFPDFRSAERAFNMLEQVSGRAGRRQGQKGVVAIQTYQPDHPVIKFVANHDYEGFYKYEIAQRQEFFYPPFSRIIYIYLKHKDARTLLELAQAYGSQLRTVFGRRVFGPEKPMISRIQGLYIRKIMLKVEDGASMAQVKKLLRDIYINLHNDPRMKALTIHYDVDPQ